MVERRRRQRLVVPDVVGLHWENARILLEQEGFPSPVVRYAEAYQRADTVVSQVPLKGQISSADQPVVLHVAKQSLLRFLPAAYQTTDSGVDPDFLRRFMWIFQEISDSFTTKIDRMHEQFSPLTADEDFLPWLAQWVALTLDSDWPNVKKRQMIRSAAELYRRRGTKGAIARLLEIFTDVRPTIIENVWPYNGFWIGAHSTIGIDTVVLPPVNLAHCFVVRFPGTSESLGEEAVARIHQIIREEKPAHTVYFLEFEGETAVGAPAEGATATDRGDDEAAEAVELAEAADDDEEEKDTGGAASPAEGGAATKEEPKKKKRAPKKKAAASEDEDEDAGAKKTKRAPAKSKK